MSVSDSWGWIMSGIFKKKEAKVIPFTQHGVRHVTINGMRLHMRWEKPDQAQIWVNGTYQLVLNREAADITEALIQAYWKYRTRIFFRKTFSGRKCSNN